ncbi:MAG TPA: ATP-binding cassette domain-containing protein, partial [Thermomicrobiales bacterium]|nr:ATP-binding cassette domain-containing protein [Thermomicrobiales bacterium]
MEAAAATAAAPSEQPVALRARDVSKRFGGVVALDEVGIEVRAGEITGLVGDNGAGKSTLIKILSAVLKPDAGAIELDGAPV